MNQAWPIIPVLGAPFVSKRVLLCGTVSKGKLKYMSANDYIRIWKTNIIFFFGKNLPPYQNDVGKNNLIKPSASCMCHSTLCSHSQLSSVLSSLGGNCCLPFIEDCNVCSCEIQHTVHGGAAGSFLNHLHILDMSEG